MSHSDDFPSGYHTSIDPPLSIDPLLVSQTAVSKRPAEDVAIIPDDSGVDGRVGVGRESVSLQIKTELTWYGSASTTFDVMGRAERSSSGIFVSSLKRRRVHSRQM